MTQECIWELTLYAQSIREIGAIPCATPQNIRCPSAICGAKPSLVLLPVTPLEYDLAEDEKLLC